MKFLNCLFATLCLVSTALAEETAIPRGRQEQIVNDYLYVTGHTRHLDARTAQAVEDSSATEMPIKCGMSAVADFVLNRNKLDRDLRAALGADSLIPRPVLPLEYVSGSGRFKVHYSKTGSDAVYQATKDSDGDGIPDYVESTAIIADSVYNHIINELGYPAPPRDDFYPSGEDSCFDIFLINLPAAFYGLSFIDSVSIEGPGGRRATSFMELDNDYQQLSGYVNRPLDAIRVTVAHEYFHSVQFGIDFTEAEDYDRPLVKRYWMEISSVWMEEEMYDDINDYYGYLPFFFNEPTRSIQQFNSFTDLHPYGAAVFGIFLAQQFGRDVMRETWLRCGEYGRGPHALQALQNVLDSMSNHTEDLSSAFARFAEWNYFTGRRAQFAPNNIGYEEAAYYPEIPRSGMAIHTDLDTVVLTNVSLAPQHMAATYILLEGDLSIEDQIRIAGLTVAPDTLCVLKFVDSLFPPGTPESEKATVEVPLAFVNSKCPGYRDSISTCALRVGCADTTKALLDSILQVDFVLDSLQLPWWFVTVDQLRSNPDSFEVEADPVAAPSFPTAVTVPTYNPDSLASEVIIVSAASPDISRYHPTQRLFMAYVMQEHRDTSNFTNVIPAVLYAYPNPAKLADMSIPSIKFRFRVQTNSESAVTCPTSFMVVDIFTAAGERVTTVSGSTLLQKFQRDLMIDLPWDGRNSKGEQVASGVYVGYARLYCNSTRHDLVAENMVKVAVIR